MKYNLKPCPVCGGEAELCGTGLAKSVFDDNGEEQIFFIDLDGYAVSCKDCAKTTKCRPQPKSAIEEWNELSEVQNE